MNWRRIWMLFGFVAALIGDWLLIFKNIQHDNMVFLCGCIAMACAQLCWSIGQFREVRPMPKGFVALSIPLLVFACVRLRPMIAPAIAVALCSYALVNATSFATALATCRRWYISGICLLMLSFVFMGERILGAPVCGMLAEPVCIVGEICLLVSFFRENEGRVAWQVGNPHAKALIGGTACVGCFLIAMATFPGGNYNPAWQMLSELGRVVARSIDWPFCHFVFTAGMLIAAATVSRVGALLLEKMPGKCRQKSFGWGIALNVAGLLVIAAVPEDVNIVFHNTGVWLAAGGGAMALFARDRKGHERIWTVLLVVAAVLFLTACQTHAMHFIPFAPWAPTLQKLLIICFISWIYALTRPFSTAGSRRLGGILGVVLLLAVSVLVWKALPPGRTTDADDDIVEVLPPVALTEGEQSALRWLEYVTGTLEPSAEQEWWDVGGRQFGLFSRRYHIAFAGYAAATIGLRGNPEERQRVGYILDNCIQRYIQTETWKYSMSNSYWGQKPWAPDPCYRENVMYTGHLLQLLALYEFFTGDSKYWTQGFDFEWNSVKVHYDVQKLIDVTVYQMRTGPHGGIACEPGLVFFPCNNHPHMALLLFARLGHGDWTEDAHRWEKWALANYQHPILGGGALNLVYHNRSGLKYPFGHPGLDGWSLLWYEPWAEHHGTAASLWQEAKTHIDWSKYEPLEDGARGKMSCADPTSVPYTATASFLAAASRACGDNETAERLEQAIDVYWKLENGRSWLELGREWRIGATANRIIALALKNGSNWRNELHKEQLAQ